MGSGWETRSPGDGEGLRAKSPSTRGAEWGHGRPGDLGHEQAPGGRGLDRPPVATRAEEQQTRGERGWPWSPEPSPDPARASPVCTVPAASAPAPPPPTLAAQPPLGSAIRGLAASLCKDARPQDAVSGISHRSPTAAPSVKGLTFRHQRAPLIPETPHDHAASRPHTRLGDSVSSRLGDRPWGWKGPEQSQEKAPY